MNKDVEICQKLVNNIHPKLQKNSKVLQCWTVKIPEEFAQKNPQTYIIYNL